MRLVYRLLLFNIRTIRTKLVLILHGLICFKHPFSSFYLHPKVNVGFYKKFKHMPITDKPLYSLTVSEFSELLIDAIKDRTSRPAIKVTTIPRQRIDGMRNLAVFLDRSLPTVQRLKNEGRIPFYNAGSKVFFYTDEVINALKSNV